MSQDTSQEKHTFHCINRQLLPMASVYGLLDALATNELEPDETEMMRQHLQQCQTCSHLLVEIGQYHRLLRGVMSNDAPAFTPDQMAEQRDARPARQRAEPAPLPSQPRRQPGLFRRTSTRLLIAAVVFALIVGDLFIFRNVLPQSQHPNGAQGGPTGTAATTIGVPTGTAATTPTEALPPDSPWSKLWTLPALPPPPPGDSPNIPQIAWSPANAQRLYLCQAGIDYEAMLRSFGGSYDTVPAVLHNLYRSDDQGLHWTAYPLPEATGNCRLEVDPTNADALVLLDGKYHAYFSRDGGQSWQSVPNPPQWNTSLVFPTVQIMAGRLYVEGYWTDDLTHWTRWYPVAGEQNHVFAQINPQHPQTLYTAIDSNGLRCAGMPSTLTLGAQPDIYQAQLCRSDDGGQTWRFIAVVVAEYGAAAAFCLALNQPETLYAWGYTAQSYPNPYPGVVTGDAMRSTDGGNTWIRLSGVFAGGGSDTANFPSCASDAYAGQSSIMVDPDDPIGGNNEWQHFGITADGTIYHVVDMAATRQGVTMKAGVSLLSGNSWQVIAPYPDGVTTPDTNYRLRMLLITPPSGRQVLLAFTDQNLYIYAGAGK